MLHLRYSGLPPRANLMFMWWLSQQQILSLYSVPYPGMINRCGSLPDGSCSSRGMIFSMCR